MAIGLVGYRLATLQSVQLPQSIEVPGRGSQQLISETESGEFGWEGTIGFYGTAQHPSLAVLGISRLDRKPLEEEFASFSIALSGRGYTPGSDPLRSSEDGVDYICISLESVADFLPTTTPAPRSACIWDDGEATGAIISYTTKSVDDAMVLASAVHQQLGS